MRIAAISVLFVVGCASSSATTALDAGLGDGARDGSDLSINDAGNDGAGPHDGGNGDGGMGPTDGFTPADMTTPTALTIRVHYPTGSHSITLRGSADTLNWTTGIPMVATSPNVYQATLPYTTEALEFKPLLDDSTWSRGPNFAMGGSASVDVYPHFTTVNGSVIELLSAFHSTALGNNRVVWAYLPASYYENTTESYPVLYMQDGQNLFDASRATYGKEWKVDETLNAAGEDGSIREMIVIGPEVDANNRDYEYLPTYDPSEMAGGGGDLYLQMLIDELKPTVDSMLRTLPDRANTGNMGSSFGGVLSCYAGVKDADVFSMIGVVSPATWWDNDYIVGEVQSTKGKSPIPDRVYMDYGGVDDNASYSQDLVAAYKSVGYVEGVNFHFVYQADGQHDETYWAARLPGALQFLFGPRTP